MTPGKTEMSRNQFNDRLLNIPSAEEFAKRLLLTNLEAVAGGHNIARV
jgi:hypothetical protein